MRLTRIHNFTLYIPALLIDFALSSVLTNSAFYTSDLQLSSTFLGLLMAIATLLFAILAIPLGQLSDQVNRRSMLYAGCFFLSVVSIGLRFCTNKYHLLLLFPGIGISMALFWPSYEAWLAEREDEGKLLHRVMLFNLFWSIGVTLGPAISGYLYQNVNPFRPFLLACAGSLLTLLTIVLQKPKSTVPISESLDEPTEILYPSRLVRKTYLNLGRCANFASWFALGVLRRLAPKLTKETGILPSTFGNFMLALGAVQTLTFLFLGTGYSTRWHYRFVPLLITQVLAIICFVGIWKVQYTFFWICAFSIIGISVAFSYFSSLYYGLHMNLDKGNKSGWHEAILGVGSLLGPMLGGIAADSTLGPQSPYIMCAVVIILAIGVEIVIISKNWSSVDAL